MAMTEGEKVFKDPVHGYIYVHEPVIWDLINTREVQRLRRVRQLGTAYLTYPGGEHSRFSHSLGVYEVIRQILSSFSRNGYTWPHEHDLLAMVSGLLHDLGHPPFSHALENFLGMRHEVWTERVIMDPSSEVFGVLEQVRTGFAGEVAAVIGRRHPNNLVVSLVSGQLDADRLDYLMRDSIFTGVDYGKFDLGRIIRVMRPHGDRIVVKQSGMHTLEAYLLARYFMYWQVYFHPSSRAAEVVLRAILARSRDLFLRGGLGPLPHRALDGLFADTLSVGDYLALDDYVLFNAFNVWQNHHDAILADLCRRFLDRRLFKDIDYGGAGPEAATAIGHVMAREGWDPRYYLAVDEIGTVYYDYYLGAGEPWATHGVILYNEASGELTEMSQVSRPVATIADERARTRRLYVPAEALAHAGIAHAIRMLVGQ